MGERTKQIITLSLPSSMQHVGLLKVIVTEILKETDFTEDIQEQINLAVIEAGTNATKHGNEEDPGRKIAFQLILAEDKLTIDTEDEGGGFTPKDTETEHVITLTLPSSMQHVYLLDVVVTEILKETDFTEDIQEQINLAVIEAGTNAIKHGNKEDPNKKATLEFTLAEDKLAILIKDEGVGFTRKEVADPLDPENLLKSSGRGLFLMEACMDSVTYEANGTIIKMVKYKETA
ncbi:MAG: ATP-binding protein [Candidatus Poribacteria bacterium]|nr:ATP-binding protein [Candidatus Poribacteria bacterium]MDD9973525.1 ATP-binding protein [Candidatus Poribacteria bacterium]MDE0323993.1 ATP-binding protein [Candidatus Poribacteria bacterium]